MNEEIIIHQNQSNLEDYLKEENQKCLGCHFYNDLDGECQDHSLNNEFSKRMVLFENTETCDNYYPRNYEELAHKVDEDTESLFEE